MDRTPDLGAGARAQARAKARGRAGEDAAAGWYVARGYTILARNWRTGEGEIDLVCALSDGSGTRVLVVCEVKARRSDRMGTPAEAVTLAKQRRLRRLAGAYLHASPSAGRFDSVRFDVACLLGSSLTVIEDAF